MVTTERWAFWAFWGTQLGSSCRWLLEHRACIILEDGQSHPSNDYVPTAEGVCRGVCCYQLSESFHMPSWLVVRNDWVTCARLEPLTGRPLAKFLPDFDGLSGTPLQALVCYSLGITLLNGFGGRPPLHEYNHDENHLEASLIAVHHLRVLTDGVKSSSRMLLAEIINGHALTAVDESAPGLLRELHAGLCEWLQREELALLPAMRRAAAAAAAENAKNS